MSGRIKYLVIGAAAVAITAFFFLRPQPALKLEYAKVKKQDISATVSASGVLAGKNRVDLNFLQGGRLAFINVKVNDRVSQGQTIAGLDTQALDIELQQANNTLRDKQAAVDKVLDDIHLFQYGNGGFVSVGSPSETMAQRQLRTTAEVGRDNSFDSIKLVQRGFQDKFIIAPFGGLVTQTNVFPGQFVSPGNLIAQVVDDSQLYFDADVDEADIGKVSAGQPVEVTLDSYPDKVFEGAVKEALPQTKTTSTQATVVTVRVLLDSFQTPIFGLQGQALIVTENAKNALTAPIEALRPDNTIVVKNPGGLQAVKVTTGIQSDTDVQIKEGLKEGQEVVVSPSSALPQNQRSLFGQFFRFFRRGQ